MIRVLIADDFRAMIHVIEAMIEQASDVTSAGVISSFSDVLERIVEIEHEVVLMSDYLPPCTSAMASEQLRELGLNTPILVMSMHQDAELIRTSLQAGANGFILKQEFGAHLLTAIRSVHAGKRYLSPAVNDVLEVHRWT